MNVNNMLHDLRELVLKLVRRGYGSAYIDRAVVEFLRLHGFNPGMSKEIQTAAQEEWVQGAVLINSRREIIIKALSSIESDFGKLDGHIRESIRRTVTAGLIEKQSLRDLTDSLVHELNKNKNWADAVAHTSKIGLSRTKTILQADVAGIKEFKYSGPGAQRDFCKDHLGKIYTIDEIKNMDNGQGLPVLNFCGGYRCVHRWQPVVQSKQKGQTYA